MSDPAPSPPQQPRRRTGPLRRIAQAIVMMLGAPVLVLALASLAAPAAWWLDLLAHFRPQYALLLAGTAAAQAILRPRALAAAWAVGAAVCAILVSPHYLHSPPPAGSAQLSIAHANLAGDSVDVPALARWIAAARPELVSLQEVTPRNLPKIEAALAHAGLAYETLAAEPREDTRGVALLSRREGIAASLIRPTPDAERPMVQAQLELEGVPIALLGFHQTRPMPGERWEWQREAIDGAALWNAAYAMTGYERLLVGDFNSTSQGVLVSRLCERADLRDARLGHGIQGTWPAHLPAIARLPIDGAYHSGGLVTTALETGPDIGSDHLPVLLKIGVRQGFRPSESPQWPPRGARSRG